MLAQFTALARPGMLTKGRDGDIAVLVLLLQKFNLMTVCFRLSPTQARKQVNYTVTRIGGLTISPSELGRL